MVKIPGKNLSISIVILLDGSATYIHTRLIKISEQRSIN